MELRSEDTRSGAGYGYIGILPDRLSLRTENAIARHCAHGSLQTVA
ncbi:MAG TPA: hypothetical protein VFZ04_08685 [Longimicrobiales bacterium]